MNTILITGGAGFIGANFIPYFLDANHNSVVVPLFIWSGNCYKCTIE